MGWLGDLFKGIAKAFGAVFFTAIFAAFGPATFLGSLISWKSLFIFGSTLVLTAFANRRPNLDLPDLTQSVFGTNEPAKTIYGEMVVGGLVSEVAESEGTSGWYAVRYAICDKKQGFTYEVVDVEIAGEWMQATVSDYRDGSTGFGLNGTGDILQVGEGKFLEIPAGNDYRGKVSVFANLGEISTLRLLQKQGWGDTISGNEVSGDPGFSGKGLIWATVLFGKGDDADELFRKQRTDIRRVRFRIKALPHGKTKSNPADVLKLHLKNEMGLADARIDDPSFTATAVECTRRNYEANGVMLAGQEYEAVSWLLQSCEASLVQDSGKFYLKGLDDPAAALTITEDMLIAEPDIQHSIPWKERYNTIRGEIIDAAQNWSKQSSGEIERDAYKTEDGEKLLLDVGGLNYVTSMTQAYRLLNEELVRRRVGKSVSVEVFHTDAGNLKAYDNVTLNLVKNGIHGKYRIVNLIHSIEGRVLLNCVSETGLQTAIADQTSVSAPASLNARPRSDSEIQLTWVSLNNPRAFSYQFRQKLSSASSWSSWDDLDGAGDWRANSGRVGGLNAGTAYDFQIRAKVGTGFSPVSNTASGTTTASQVFNITLGVVRSGTNFTITWSPGTIPSDGSYYSFELAWKRSTDSAYPAATVSYDRTPGQQSPQTLAGAHRFTRNVVYNFRMRRVRVRSGSTTYSPWSNTVTVTYDVPAPPPALQAPGPVRNLRQERGRRNYIRLVSWDAPNTGGAATSYEWGVHHSSVTSPVRWYPSTSNPQEVRRGLAPQNLFVRARNAAGAGPARYVFG